MINQDSPKKWREVGSQVNVDKKTINFSDVAKGNQLPLIHPGEILRDEFLIPMEMSVYQLAKDIHVPRTRLNDIVLGRRSITPDTALRLSRYFGITPEFWLNLQMRYDLEDANRNLKKKIAKEILPRSAA